jgi:hypothetical protein
MRMLTEILLQSATDALPFQGEFVPAKDSQLPGLATSQYFGWFARHFFNAACPVQLAVPGRLISANSDLRGLSESRFERLRV